VRVYLHYETRDPIVYIAVWYHGAQSGGLSPHDSPTFFTMAKNNTERSDLDKKNDDRVTTEVSNVTPLNCDEPIVTRWELWSYYCKCHRDFPLSLQCF